MAKVPLHPKHPERICWGCDKYCPADSLACGNGTIRTQHPVELFGEDWLEWSPDNSADNESQIPIQHEFSEKLDIRQ
jgi:hypothetical protein